MNMNEETPYRSGVPSHIMETEPQRNSTDEANYDTLRIVYSTLKEAIDDLDSWHAFDLNETELEIKQQIKAHQLAFEVLSPLLEIVRDALTAVDSKYKER